MAKHSIFKPATKAELRERKIEYIIMTLKNIEKSLEEIKKHLAKEK